MISAFNIASLQRCHACEHNSQTPELLQLHSADQDPSKSWRQQECGMDLSGLGILFELRLKARCTFRNYQVHPGTFKTFFCFDRPGVGQCHSCGKSICNRKGRSRSGECPDERCEWIVSLANHRVSENSGHASLLDS